MLKKLIRLFALILMVNAMHSELAFANNGIFIGESRDLSSEVSHLINNSWSIKKGQPYDEANETAFRTFNGGPTEGPQHGYFAVPLIVIGIAGILLYFSRND